MGGWREVAGSNFVTEPIPHGALAVRYAAKGTSGFYELGRTVQWRLLANLR